MANGQGNCYFSVTHGNASTYYTNLVASNNWKTEINKHAQIIALTTQISKLKKEFSQAKSSANAFTPTPAPGTTGIGSNQFEQWRLEKINNKEEFNMIVKDGKKYFWCNKHKYPSSDVQGMYVFHKPTEHEVWLTCKQTLNEQCNGKGGKDKATTPTSAPTPKPSSMPNAAKLSLAKSLQEALTTTAGLAE
jgi:hypothetical protein